MSDDRFKTSSHHIYKGDSYNGSNLAVLGIISQLFSLDSQVDKWDKIIEEHQAEIDKAKECLGIEIAKIVELKEALGVLTAADLVVINGDPI